MIMEMVDDGIHHRQHHTELLANGNPRICRPLHLKKQADFHAPISRYFAYLSTIGFGVEVCLDVTDVDVLDEGGQSVVPSTRLDRQAVSVDLTHADTATGLAISASNAIESELCD